MKIGIPTYKRDEVKTLSWLSKVFSRDEIIIATQRQEDYDRISARYGDVATVIFGEANCVGGNRNNILRHCEGIGERECLMLDDDVRNVLIWQSKKRSRRLTPDEVRATAAHCFELARANNAKLWGTAPVPNPFFQNAQVWKQALLTGTMYGVCDTSLRFDESYRIKEDMELCIRVLSQGYNVLRFNALGVEAAHKSKGGCDEWWNGHWDERCTTMLAQSYPMMIKLISPTKITLRHTPERL